MADVHPISYLAGLLQSLLAAASAEPYNGVTLPQFGESQTSPAQSAQGCPNLPIQTGSRALLSQLQAIQCAFARTQTIQKRNTAKTSDACSPVAVYSAQEEGNTDLYSLTHCGRVTQICVLNTVNLDTSASSP